MMTKTLLFALAMLAMTVSKTMADLAAGDPAPAFSATATSGETISLEDQAGKWVVLYFYPKADTPGCTKQACSLRDGNDLLKEMGAVVIGASMDDLAAQQRFKEKYNLNFELIADNEGVVTEAYGVKNFTRLIAQRKTFIINPEGVIAYIFDKVKVSDHANEVAEKLKELQAANAALLLERS